MIVITYKQRRDNNESATGNPAFTTKWCQLQGCPKTPDKAVPVID